MTTTLEVAVRRSAAHATIDLVGDIDGRAREALEAAYADAATGSNSILLNCERVGYINSTGIALIVGLLGRARADHVPLGACGLSDHYREIFEITRLADFMSIYPDEAAALSADQGRPQ
jgi:anti-anti-sigma factor